MWCVQLLHSHCCVVFHSMNIQFLIPPTGNHWGCFQFMAMVNNAAVHIVIYACGVEMYTFLLYA